MLHCLYYPRERTFNHAWAFRGAIDFRHLYQLSASVYYFSLHGWAAQNGMARRFHGRWDMAIASSVVLSPCYCSFAITAVDLMETSRLLCKLIAADREARASVKALTSIVSGLRGCCTVLHGSEMGCRRRRSDSSLKNF